MFIVPISVLSEITGTAEKELRTAYSDKLTGADNDLLPVGILPHDQIELCLEKYLFHDRYLDIDLFRIASRDLPNTESTSPCWQDRISCPSLGKLKWCAGRIVSFSPVPVMGL